MTDHKSLQDHALDAVVYLPVGAVLAARDELPKLTAKGRAYVTTQLTMARTVGNFAVTFGSREAEKQVLRAVRRLGRLWGEGPLGGGGRGTAGGDTEEGTTDAARSTTSAAPPPDTRGTPDTSINGRVPATINGNAPSSESLAIIGYDSLSAPQVVQRLAGLSSDELEAVRDYEASTRGRATILNRATQLLASPPSSEG